ncbi:MAG: hypothetical protein ABJN26_14315 [Stappiaceae bacterium]
MRPLLLIAALLISNAVLAAEQRWCGDGLPFSFLKDGQNILIVRPSQIATCKPSGGNNYVCAEELSGASAERFEVTAEVTSNGNLSFGNKGQQPTLYTPCQ